MRTLPLPLVPLLAACAASDAARPVWIEDFVEKSVEVKCEPVPSLSARESVVADVATLSDSTFLVLYDRDREVALVGPDLQPRWVVAFAADGPTGVRRPTSATLVADTIYVADQGQGALKRLGLDGSDRGRVLLPFPPQQVRSWGGQVFVTPLVLGRHPGRLVYRLAGDDVVPLEVPAARYGDLGVNALANLAGVAAYPDGRIVVTHEFVVPLAHELHLDAAGEARRLPVPLPEEVGARLERIPRGTIDEIRPADLPVAVIAAVADPRTGDLVVLTRSGREGRDGNFEKAVIRLDSRLEYRSSYLLDVNAIRMAYLAAKQVAVVVDEVDQWYTCSVG